MKGQLREAKESFKTISLTDVKIKTLAKDEEAVKYYTAVSESGSTRTYCYAEVQGDGISFEIALNLAIENNKISNLVYRPYEVKNRWNDGLSIPKDQDPSAATMPADSGSVFCTEKPRESKRMYQGREYINHFPAGIVLSKELVFAITQKANVNYRGWKAIHTQRQGAGAQTAEAAATLA